MGQFALSAPPQTPPAEGPHAPYLHGPVRSSVRDRRSRAQAKVWRASPGRHEAAPGTQVARKLSLPYVVQTLFSQSPPA